MSGSGYNSFNIYSILRSKSKAYGQNKNKIHQFQQAPLALITKQPVCSKVRWCTNKVEHLVFVAVMLGK